MRFPVMLIFKEDLVISCFSTVIVHVFHFVSSFWHALELKLYKCDAFMSMNDGAWGSSETNIHGGEKNPELNIV